MQSDAYVNLVVGRGIACGGIAGPAGFPDDPIRLGQRVGSRYGLNIPWTIRGGVDGASSSFFACWGV